MNQRVNNLLHNYQKNTIRNRIKLYKTIQSKSSKKPRNSAIHLKHNPPAQEKPPLHQNDPSLFGDLQCVRAVRFFSAVYASRSCASL